MIKVSDPNIISTIDKQGATHTFNVAEEEIELGGYKGVFFRIYEDGGTPFSCFIFQILFVDNENILLFLVSNQDLPKFMGKGIVKPMIELVRNRYKKNIISSTRRGRKYLNDEGRIEEVTEYWEKWQKENPNIKYNSIQDRFVYYI